MPTVVTVIIPLRNEVSRIPALLETLASQTRQPDEIIVMDGMSTDGSREALARAAITVPGLRVVDNADRVVPAALNVGLGAASGDLIARMDTHADYAPDYLERVVAFLEARPDCGGVGGLMKTDGRGAWGKSIASTLSRPFGLGGARHRLAGEAGPIPHVFSGCYRRTVLDLIGGWDERLLANEDFEADIRVGKSGYLVWLEPDARSVWYVRENLPALSKQMWRYGFYKGLTLRKHPDSLQVRQLAPPTMVVGLLALLVLRPRAGIASFVAYLLGAGSLGARAAHEDGASVARGALVPPVVHLSWGTGLLVGLARFARADRGNQEVGKRG